MKNGIQDFEIIDDGLNSAFFHMEKDRELISGLENLKRPLLRFYEWEKKAITYGHFIDPHKYLKLECAKKLGFDIARRPTGGGILFHIQDFTFTVAIPCHHPNCSKNVLENYHFVNSTVLQAIHEIGSFCNLAEKKETLPLREFCMATPTQYDLLLHGYKIGGAAQRMTRFGFVHQASIFLTNAPWDILEELLYDGKNTIETMKKVSSHIHASQDELKEKLSLEFTKKIERN